MAVVYPPFLHLADESAYRARFEANYCAGPLLTFDGVSVRFRKKDFDHCFYESPNRDKRKTKFSTFRSQRIDWIKLALEDTEAELYQGWDNDRQRYDPDRRVAVVHSNYVVIVLLTGDNKANFMTCFVANTPESLKKIRMSPKWEVEEADGEEGE